MHRMQILTQLPHEKKISVKRTFKRMFTLELNMHILPRYNPQILLIYRHTGLINIDGKHLDL